LPAPELNLEALEKTFAGRERVRALRACSLVVRAGECVAILGASGCGKTTLLRVVAGLEVPDAGSVRFDARDVSREPAERRNVGFVFQNDALFGGERQRVALARALAVDPEVLLFDEPLSRLDAPLRAELRRELAEIVRTRFATTLYVTHDQSEALALGDRIAVMREGTIVQIASASELFERPRDTFVAASLGTPAIAFVPAALVFADADPGERCGVRASAVRIADDGELRGIVRSVEELLDVAYAFVEGPFGALVVRIDDARPVPGERIALRIDRARVLRFDREGTRIEPRVHA
jgi:ABC-type sugar transport system ATPase subunit